jgi:hypothetical protein
MVILNEVLFMGFVSPFNQTLGFSPNKGTAISFQIFIVLLFDAIIM